MILDKLIEKKDLNAYITHRIVHLEEIRDKMIAIAEDKQKQLLSERFRGRTLELEELRIVLAQDKLKEMSKTYSNEIRRKE